VFEPFYRSPSVIAKQIRGTGLGLTLAKTTVEAVGGSISISSVVDKGSIFVVHLPLAEGKAAGSGEARFEVGASS
jgi:signal transduction histidine kinase